MHCHHYCQETWVRSKVNLSQTAFNSACENRSLELEKSCFTFLPDKNLANTCCLLFLLVKVSSLALWYLSSSVFPWILGQPCVCVCVCVRSLLVRHWIKSFCCLKEKLSSPSLHHQQCDLTAILNLCPLQCLCHIIL